MNSQCISLCVLIFQCLWRMNLAHMSESLDRSTFIAKNTDPRFKTMTAAAKKMLKQAPLADIQLKENEFPDVEYPSSIFDIHNNFYYNPKFDTEAMANASSKLPRPRFENYKRKQRIRAMNNSLKKVQDTFEKNEPVEPTIHDESRKKGMTVKDKLLVDKILSRKPWQKESLADHHFGPNLNNDWKINNTTKDLQPSIVEENKTSDLFTSMTIPSIVDNLISITEEIFDSLMLYLSENTGINILTEEETNEILHIVENLNEVLNILEYLSGNETFTNHNDTHQVFAASKSLDSSSFAENQTFSSEIINKNSEIPLVEAVDEAISKLEIILNGTSTSSSNHTGEITRISSEMVDSFKRVSAIMEEVNKNTVSDFDTNSTQLVDEELDFNIEMGHSIPLTENGYLHELKTLDEDDAVILTSQEPEVIVKFTDSPPTEKVEVLPYVYNGTD